MPVSMSAARTYSIPAVPSELLPKPVVGSIPLKGHTLFEPLTEMRPEDTTRKGRASRNMFKGSPMKAMPGSAGSKPGDHKENATAEEQSTPWKPPAFQLHLPTPDFGRFLSPGLGLGEKATHTYARIRNRVSPTKRIRRPKKDKAAAALNTPGSGAPSTARVDNKTPSNKTPGSNHSFAAPRTPAPAREHKENAIVVWCQDAGLDGIDGLSDVLLSEAEDLNKLREQVENNWDGLMAALVPLDLKGIKIRKVRAALGALKTEAQAFQPEAAMTWREGVQERILHAPLDLGTSVTSEAAQLQPVPMRPKIGDLRRAANAEPPKYANLPRAVAPPEHNKENRAKARTNAGLAEASASGKPNREALKLGLRVQGAAEAKGGRMVQPLDPSPAPARRCMRPYALQPRRH